MKKSIQRVLVLLLTLSMVFSTMAVPGFADDGTSDAGQGTVTEAAEDAGESSALDQVLASIGELSNDPRDFTAADTERIEAIQAAYDALSEEEQATVDSTFDHPSGDGQSYGRVLQAALWAVHSYGTDTSTTLPDATYTTTTDRAVSSKSDKGKSDSSRERNWWVESVVVENGQATAYIYVTSGAATAKKLTSYPSVWVGGQTIDRNADNNYPIPVDLNGITYFGGISSSMPRPIMYSLETTIDESAVEADADYTAVDAALAKVPEDLSIYTDESAAAVTAAVDAVVRGKKASEQAAVDAMAQAIEDAVAALEEKPAEPEVVELAITNNTGMFKAVTASLVTEDGQEYLVMALSGTGYKELYKGTYEQAVANGDGTADNGNDSWVHGYTNEDGKLEFKIPMGADETYVPCVAVSNSYYTKYLNGQNALARAFYPRQFELDREAKTLVTGDYEFTQDLAVTNNVKMFKVDAAKLDTVGGPNSNNYKADLVLTMGSTAFDKMYVGTSAEAAEAAAPAALGEDNTFTVPVKWVKTFGDPETLETLVGEPFTASFHSQKKDIWYEREITINEEDGTIVFNDIAADYTAVDAALAKVPEDLSIYTDESAAAVTAAVDAVVRDKNAGEQTAVDAMAQAIEDAVAALEEKQVEPALADGTYTATKVSTDVTTDASGMIMVTKATVVIKDGKATAIVTMKGTGADRLYVSETATKDTIVQEAVAEEQKEVGGEYGNLIGGLKLPGESAYSFWPIPVTLGEPTVYAARSASHFQHQDKTPEEYYYVHDFQIDAADLEKVSDDTELSITEEQEAQRYLNQYFLDGKVVTAATAASVKGKDGNVTIPYYDVNNAKISSVIFKMAESEKFRSGWFVDSSILNTTYFSNSNLKKIRYPEGANGKVTFSPKATYRDEGMTFTATLKLYPADAAYNQYDADGVYYDREPLAEQTFTFTVEPLPGDRHVTIEVVDAVSKEPVEGATVTVTKDADASAVEAEEGVYTMTVPDTYTIKASAEGYMVPGTEETEYVQTAYAPKKDGEKVTISLIKAEQSKNTITFDLKDQMGNAVVDPSISVYPWSDKEAVVAPEADGSYKLYYGTRYGYTVTAEGYEEKTATFTPSQDDVVEAVINKYLSEQSFTFRVYDNKTNETLEGVDLTVKFGPSGEDESTYTEAQPDENGVYTIPIDNRVIAYGHKTGYEDNSLGVWSAGFDPLKDCSFGMDPLPDADYTAVDAALETIPADLSIYTQKSAAAVKAAQDAVVRGKKTDEQAAVDAMAKAIEDAVDALKIDISKATVEGVVAKTYTGKAQTQKPTVKVNGVVLTKDDDYSITYKNNTNAGTATMTVTGKGKYAGSVNKTFKINAKKIDATVKLSSTVLTYNGKNRCPYIYVYDGSKKLVKGTDYKVSLTSSRKNVGTYTVTIKLKGNYTGDAKKATFKIRPKGTDLSSVKAGSKQFTVTWKKQATQTSGYQIQYSTSSTFASGNKLVTVKSLSTTSKVIKGLKASKKYYVRVRTIKDVKVTSNGKTTTTRYYSPWSDKKTVTTKK